MLDVKFTDAGYAVKQAGMTAADYLGYAIEYIDRAFGDGYAKKNPALVGVFMTVCARDFATTIQKATAQDMRDALCDLEAE
jgi:hypothetical protein